MLLIISLIGDVSFICSTEQKAVGRSRSKYAYWDVLQSSRVVRRRCALTPLVFVMRDALYQFIWLVDRNSEYNNHTEQAFSYWRCNFLLVQVNVKNTKYRVRQEPGWVEAGRDVTRCGVLRGGGRGERRGRVSGPRGPVTTVPRHANLARGSTPEIFSS